MYINGEIKINGYTTVTDIDEGECFHYADDDTIYMKTDDCESIVRMCDGSICISEEDRPVEEIETELKVVEKEKRTKEDFKSIEKINSLFSVPIPETIRYALNLNIDDLVIVKLNEDGNIIITTEKEDIKNEN